MLQKDYEKFNFQRVEEARQGRISRIVAEFSDVTFRAAQEGLSLSELMDLAYTRETCS
ncbi:hypothetical protein [Caudoviricetes sp.]|nr:hypothetical protein [Caudoviricetes sp.]